MVFWKKKKRGKKEETTVKMSGGSAPISGPSRKRYTVEVKLLAAQARASGLGSGEVAKLIGSSANSVDKWLLMILIRERAFPRECCSLTAMSLPIFAVFRRPWISKKTSASSSLLQSLVHNRFVHVKHRYV